MHIMVCCAVKRSLQRDITHTSPELTVTTLDLLGDCSGKRRNSWTGIYKSFISFGRVTVEETISPVTETVDVLPTQVTSGTPTES